MIDAVAVDDTFYPELFFGLVGPIGVDMDAVQDALADALSQVGYLSHKLHLTKLLGDYEDPGKGINRPEDYSGKIDRARDFCATFSDGAAIAALAVTEIREIRNRSRSTSGTQEVESDQTIPKTAFIIRQLKRAPEIEFLRKLYGQKFVQVSVTLDKESRVRNLVGKLSTSHPEWSPQACESQARSLIEIDEREQDTKGVSIDFGQQVGEIFHLGDFFVVGDSPDHIRKVIEHCIRAFFGENSRSPTKDEFGAYMAIAASLRSVDLSRQVGAAILSKTGDVVSLGCNEVPKAFGGNYWFDDEKKYRDVEMRAEQNSVEKQRIIVDFIERLKCPISDDHISPRRSALFMARSVLRDIRDGGRSC